MAEGSQICPKCGGYTGGGICSACANLKAALLPPPNPSDTSPTQEVETWTFYWCEEHGPLPRSATRLGMQEPVGGRLECAYCEWDEHSAPAFVEEVEMLGLDDHQKALQAEVEKREEVEEEARDLEAASIERGERVIELERRLTNARSELKRRAASHRVPVAAQNAYLFASKLLRDEGDEQGGAGA